MESYLNVKIIEGIDMILDLLSNEFNEINRPNILTLITLYFNKYSTAIDLANKLSKNRTTIQKILTDLLDLKLVKRYQINLNKGFTYKYEVIIDIEKLVFKSLMNKHAHELEVLNKIKWKDLN